MTDGEDARDPEVGSLAEETAKLLGALSGWARDHGAADVAQGMAGAADGVGQFVHEVDQHIATGSAECTYCPICRTVHAVRTLNPEVKHHLAVAASSLAQAAAGMLATVAPQPDADRTGHPGAEASTGVEHIDLDEDWPDDTEPAGQPPQEDQ
ncbi:hypothetical protein DDE18_10355 [Nocardioides gansuensis]|uniref:Uncharacterized protein n=1 Tax=Nocardioides gansuensis TaxID=2138300 RepID=A0A2T8FAP0_9ACTN|nr:hypothetical protein [Nocardioides gansuensis]PVG82757.1 hypothetical protein DDE18_10355 [Nocardioides gansuensis]